MAELYIPAMRDVVVFQKDRRGYPFISGNYAKVSRFFLVTRCRVYRFFRVRFTVFFG
jgi:hypothetical protein